MSPLVSVAPQKTFAKAYASLAYITEGCSTPFPGSSYASVCSNFNIWKLCVCPEFSCANLNEAFRWPPNEEKREKTRETLHKCAAPHHIAGPILFLCGDWTSLVTIQPPKGQIVCQNFSQTSKLWVAPNHNGKWRLIFDDRLLHHNMTCPSGSSIA